MKKLRFGIIGCGIIGSGHARRITGARSRDFSLAAVADIDTDRARAIGGEHDVPWFDDGRKLIDSGLVDAVVIGTPHYFHPPLAIRAARAGLHVMSEKPIAVSVGPARAMVAECAKAGVVLGVMFQHRLRPEYRRMKRMIDSGKIGRVFRVQMLCSSWYRTQEYYRAGAWRGTWDGEGGGVLMNQAPHSLDTFAWIGGLPGRVVATLGRRVVDIEVENVANAVLEYEDGKTGYIYATTAEWPGVEQFMVCGEKGTLVAQGGTLRLGKVTPPIDRHLLTAKRGFGKPLCRWKDIPLPAGRTGHINVIRPFAASILRGTPLIADGNDGINQLTLCNAIYLAGFRQKPVDLPLAPADVERLLTRLVRTRSAGRGGNLRRQADADLKKLLGKSPV